MKKLRMALLVGMVLVMGLSFAQEIVRAYTTFEEQLAMEVFQAFEQATGIKVEWVRLSGGEAIARMEAERANPQASIWVGGVGLNHIEAKNKGLTTPYRSRAAVHTPAEFIDPEYYWIGLYIGPLAFATNINRARELGLEAPQGWFDIIDSKYANLVRVANPATSGTAYNVITTLISLFGGDEDVAFMYLEKLDQSIDQYTRSGSAPGRSVAIGEIPFSIGYAHDMVRLKVEGGAPIEITVPREGTGYELASMSLIHNGPEPVNAKKLYDFVLGLECLEILASWYVVPVSSIAPTQEVAINIADLKTVHQDFVWDGANRERLVDRWNREIGAD